jgi:hypothetical protein
LLFLKRFFAKYPVVKTNAGIWNSDIMLLIGFDIVPSQKCPTTTRKIKRPLMLSKYSLRGLISFVILIGS